MFCARCVHCGRSLLLFCNSDKSQTFRYLPYGFSWWTSSPYRTDFQRYLGGECHNTAGFGNRHESSHSRFNYCPVSASGVPELPVHSTRCGFNGHRLLVPLIVPGPNISKIWPSTHTPATIAHTTGCMRRSRKLGEHFTEIIRTGAED